MFRTGSFERVFLNRHFDGADAGASSNICKERQYGSESRRKKTAQVYVVYLKLTRDVGACVVRRGAHTQNAHVAELEVDEAPDFDLEARLGSLMATHKQASQNLMVRFAPLTY